MSQRPATAAGRARSTAGKQAKAAAAMPAKRPVPSAKPSAGRTAHRPAASKHAASPTDRRPQPPRPSGQPKQRAGKRPAAKPNPSRSAHQRPRSPKQTTKTSRVSIGDGAAKLARRITRPRVLIAVAAAILALAVIYQFVLRDLSLFAVEDLKITGLEETVGGDDLEQRLTAAAGEMTTLHVDESALEAAVAGSPAVTGLDVSTDFPHAMTITVHARRPVAVVRDRRTGRLVQVGADGTILAQVSEPDAELPLVEVDSVPGAGTLTGEGLAIAQIAGAAPPELRELIDDVAWSRHEDGVEVTLEGGIPIRFGTGERAGAKWAAAAAILADPAVVALTYLDVSVPERPALGGNA